MSWINGEEIEYTGKSEIIHGCRFFEYEIKTGHETGKLKVTSLCPECGMRFGQDKRIPCHNCEIE